MKHVFIQNVKKLEEKLRLNQIKVEDLVSYCCKKAEETEDLNAYICKNPSIDSQLEESVQNVKDGKCRPLEGIPIAVKDNFCVEGMETTCGSKMLKNFKPPYTATVVDKLLNLGAVLIGKTNMDEFAMGSGTVTSIFGPTKNFWGSKHCRSNVNIENDWFISGGSSGGSAVAVASKSCFGALGSDTGGSCRNPAAYCGVVGLKPTYGLLSRHGLIPLVNSMDVPGIFTLTVENAAVLLSVLAGHDEKDPTTVATDLNLNLNFNCPSVKGLKIGIPKEYNCEGLSEEVKIAWNNVAQILETGGAKIMPLSMPHTQYSVVCYSILNQCEVASNMARYDGIEFGHRAEINQTAEQMFTDTRSSGFNDIVKSRILAGNYFLLSENYEKYFEKALKVRRLISNDFKKAWRNGFNILLTPTTLTDAPRHSEFVKKNQRKQSETQDYFTQPANMTGCPAISIPICLSRKGLPISVQLMAPNFEEKTLLEAALYVENAVNFTEHW